MATKVLFPKTLAAARAMEADQWALGDALLEECGAPGDDHAHNGSGQKLAEASAVLLANGLDYAENTLRVFRDISHLYPHATRVASVSWTVHRAVFDGPEVLNRLLEGLSEGETLTASKAQDLSNLIRAEAVKAETAERKAAREAAYTKELAAKKRQQDASRDAKKATTTAARLRAEKAEAQAEAEAEAARKERIEKQKVPDPHEVVIQNLPPADRIPSIGVPSHLIGEASRASRMARNATELWQERGDEVNDGTIDAIIETGLAAHQAWLDFVNAVRRNRTNKRSHLAVVGEN